MINFSGEFRGKLDSGHFHKIKEMARPFSKPASSSVWSTRYLSASLAFLFRKPFHNNLGWSWCCSRLGNRQRQ